MHDCIVHVTVNDFNIIVCRVHFKSMHVKAREASYPNTKVQRFPVPDDKVPWDTSFPEYKPVVYTSKNILSGPVYADPDIRYSLILRE